jgi:hypothetical protein
VLNAAQFRKVRKLGVSWTDRQEGGFLEILFTLAWHAYTRRSADIQRLFANISIRESTGWHLTRTGQ